MENSRKENAKEKKDGKGKQVVADENQSNNRETNTDNNCITDTDRARPHQTLLDEMLAASLAAEEEDNLYGGNKTTSAGNAQPAADDDDDDDEEEMLIPITSGNIDPSILASLPPSMQLDLLVQMRERQMAENRQKYQEIKKTPTKFSELQIQSYLKTVAFRREINEVQKCAAGKGLGGVQSSRIASQANREFIFSSSFTGDKQILSAKTVEKDVGAVNQSTKKRINLDSMKRSLFASQSQSRSPAESSVDKVTSDFGNGVETYHDESGRLRVSRHRGLGIRMTRDLQRNLDLMKEYEQDCSKRDICTDLQPKCSKEVSSAKGTTETNRCHNASVSNEGNSTIINGKTVTLTEAGNDCSDGLSLQSSKAMIEVSFSEDDGGMKDTDDNLFLHLVSGTSTSTLFSASLHSDRSENESESECLWEEGTIGEKDESFENDQNKEDTSPLAEDNRCEESEVEWEEGDCDIPKDVCDCQAEQEKPGSRALLEEEADIQEAIRRSLQGTEMQKTSTKSSSIGNLETSEYQNSLASPHDFSFEENRESTQLLPKHPETSLIPCTTPDGVRHQKFPSQESVQQNVANSFDEKTVATEKTIGKLMVLSELEDSKIRTPVTDEEDAIKHRVNHEDQCLDTSEQSGIGPPSLRIPREDIAGNSATVDFKALDNLPGTIPDNAYDDITLEPSQSLVRKGETSFTKENSLMEEKITNNDTVQEEVMGNHSSTIPTADGLHFISGITTQQEANEHNVVSEANLDEEISLLRQERLILGDEQRKLERNAESVSSEMFAECQELLQMFGLPYIIAPMEAEAQCAYMEMSNLVDGVVTDDSDVFLFGARNIYKNIFDDRKYVETYFMKDIESELGLNRETLIHMAMLLGSDYTVGVSGIGIVNAIEVVRAFPEEDGLRKFREWIESPDPSILGNLNSRTGSNSNKRSLKSSNNDEDGMRDNAQVFSFEVGGHEGQSSVDGIKEIFMSKHRNVSKNWHLPSSFPSDSVITAYTSPQVDDSTEPFTWGKPDLVLLRKLCWQRFGWDNKKADELLIPVLKEYNKHETQLRLEAFYTFNERFAKIRSQRIKKAVKGITGKSSAELMGDIAQASSSGKKRGGKSSALEKHKPEHYSEVKDNSTRKASRKPKRQKIESLQSENGVGDMLTPEEGRRINKNDLAANSSGRRGRVRERSRGRGRGRGRGKEVELNNDSTEVSSSDDYSDKGEMEKHIQVSEATSELRRSTRCRKHVKYSEEKMDMEIDAHNLKDVAKEQESVEQGSSIRIGPTGDASNHKEGSSHSPQVSLSRDYLVSGGGFCTDESETQGDALYPAASPATNSAEKGSAAGFRYSSVVDRQPANPASLYDGSHSRDYLLTGGGFCMDESEKHGDATHVDDGSGKEDQECYGQNTREHTGGNSLAREHMGSAYLEEAEEEGETNLSLTAMPSLRKKRRKV